LHLKCPLSYNGSWFLVLCFANSMALHNISSQLRHLILFCCLSMEFLCGIACHKSDSPKWNLHDWQACAFWDAFQPSPAYPRVGGPARPSGPGDLLISLRIPPQPAPVQPAGTALHCSRGVGELSWWPPG
jgi:hypothetical protein